MMKKSEDITELAKAFAKTQAELKQPLKDADNPFFKSKYVPLENVVESIMTSASRNGLSFTQFPSQSEDGLVAVGTMVMHESGQWIEYDPIKLRPIKNDPQAIGSAITYAKRYALSAIFGITSDQDDDGNEATRPKAETKSQTKHSGRKMSMPISEIQVETYKADLKDLSLSTGKDIEKWFLEKMEVTTIADIRVEQLTQGNKLIAALKEKAGKGE